MKLHRYSKGIQGFLALIPLKEGEGEWNKNIRKHNRGKIYENINLAKPVRYSLINFNLSKWKYKQKDKVMYRECF